MHCHNSWCTTRVLELNISNAATCSDEQTCSNQSHRTATSDSNNVKAATHLTSSENEKN